MFKSPCIKYCTSGNIREVLIFANFVRRTNSRIEESGENYYYNNIELLKKIENFANSKLRKKSQNQKFAKIQTRENYQIYNS